MTDIEELIERLNRNRDALRYALDWECNSRTQIGTIYKTFSRYNGEDYSVTTKEQLEQLYSDIIKTATALSVQQREIAELREALEKSKPKYAQPCFDHEYITPGCSDCGKLA